MQSAKCSTSLRHEPLLLVLTANGIAAAAQTEITHFMYASHNVIWQQYLETMACAFEATTGIKVNIVPSSGNYREKLMTLIAAGATRCNRCSPGFGLLVKRSCSRIYAPM